LPAHEKAKGVLKILNLIDWVMLLPEEWESDLKTRMNFKGDSDRRSTQIFRICWTRYCSWQKNLSPQHHLPELRGRQSPQGTQRKGKNNALKKIYDLRALHPIALGDGTGG